MAATNIAKVLKKLSDESVLKQIELAELLGYRKQNLNGILSGRRCNDMTAGLAIRIADKLGYQMVFVPKGKKLPEGSEVVEIVDDEKESR